MDKSEAYNPSIAHDFAIRSPEGVFPIVSRKLYGCHFAVNNLAARTVSRQSQFRDWTARVLPGSGQGGEILCVSRPRIGQWGTDVSEHDEDGPRERRGTGEREVSRGRPAIDTMTSASPATNEATASAALTITVPFTDKKGASNSRSFLCSRLRSSPPLVPPFPGPPVLAPSNWVYFSLRRPLPSPPLPSPLPSASCFAFLILFFFIFFF